MNAPLESVKPEDWLVYSDWLEDQHKDRLAGHCRLIAEALESGLVPFVLREGAGLVNPAHSVKYSGAAYHWQRQKQRKDGKTSVMARSNPAYALSCRYWQPSDYRGLIEHRPDLAWSFFGLQVAAFLAPVKFQRRPNYNSPGWNAQPAPSFLRCLRGKL